MLSSPFYSRFMSFSKAIVFGLWCGTTVFFAPVTSVKAEPPSPTSAHWNLQELEKTPATFPAPEVPTPQNLKTLYFEGLPYKGKATKVFAFYGTPAGADAQHKVPAIILVHGAGGSAFEAWVRLWNSRGYAAIAFDHEGNLPLGTYNHWQRQADGGPRRSDVGDLANPLADQWMYHAVADCLLAHSLLASFPEVDATRIGITGISWGGVITSIAASVDPRLKYAVPVYGCGFIAEDFDDGSQFVGKKAPDQARVWREFWDPKNFLPLAKLPILWVNGTNDFAFTMRSWQLSYRAAPGPHTLSLRVGMKHGHNGPGESPEEIRAFADSIVKGGAPLATISPLEQNGNEVSASYQSTEPIKTATLNYTTDGGAWQTRKWEALPATLSAGKVSAALPEKVTTYYFTLIDNRDLVVTSEHQTVEVKNAPSPAGAQP